MEKSFFFNAKKSGETYDRVYQAEDFASYFAEFIGNGVFPNPSTGLQVVESASRDMTTILKPGAAFINGYGYKNTGDIVFTHKVADGSLNRKDAIFIRFDNAGRAIGAIKMEGSVGAEAVAPKPTRTADYYDLCVAVINVNAGITGITQALIEDTRMSTDLCGIVHAVVEQIDTDTLYKQVQSDLANFKSGSEADFAQWSSKQQSDYQSWSDAQKAAFDAWFETLKGKLGDDPATNLQTQIEKLNAAVTGYQLKLTAGTNALQITAKRNSIESLAITGFTKQDGSGDPGPENVREITTGGLRMVAFVLDGSKNWTSSATNTSGKYRWALSAADIGISLNAPSTNNDVAKIFSGGFAAVAANSTLNLSAGIAVDISGNLRIYDPGCNTSLADWKAKLNKSPLPIWAIPAEESQETSIYLPIEHTDEEGYHCDCIELSADLCEGDKVETCVKSGCDKRIVIDANTTFSESTTNSGKKQFLVSLPDSLVAATAATLGNISSNLYTAQVADAIYLSDKKGIALATDGRLIIFDPSIQTIEQAQTIFGEKNLIVWYRSTSYTKENDIPVQLETHIRALGKIDAVSGSVTNGRQANQDYYGCEFNGLSKLISSDEPDVLGDISKYIGTDAAKINGDQFTLIANSNTLVFGVKKSLVPEGTKEAVSEYMAVHPISIEYPLAAQVVYARDPVSIQTADGSTNVSTPEGCVLEVELTKNESKTFKATLLMDSWQSSGSEYTQEAAVQCIDGIGFITSESEWDSAVWAERTTVLSTNEKLAETLGIINVGDISFKNGAIYCRVSEKPTSDIEIAFKAKR